MPVEPIIQSAGGIDLSARFAGSSTVGASPALAAETIIGTLTLPTFGAIAVIGGIRLQGWAAFTVGTSGTAATLRLRQTNVSGNVVVSSGAVTATAANLMILDVLGADATPAVGVYVLTLQITGGAAVSTVSALHISGTIL